MRFCSIASGSSGNCLYVGSDTTHILIDAGISAKRTEEGLNGLGLSLCDIDAILVTHEHSDHVKGLGVLARKYSIPIYSSEGTVHSLVESGCLGKVDNSLLDCISADSAFYIKDILIKPFRISHDASEPIGYRLESENKKIGIVTDLGVYNDYIIESLKGLDVLLAEANHDIRMLQVGPYPYYLKQRILSDRGHLSNENSGRMISRLLNDNIKHIYLGHLSKENNIPELAYETVRLEIEASDTKYHGNDFPLSVAKRDCPMEPIEF